MSGSVDPDRFWPEVIKGEKIVAAIKKKWLSLCLIALSAGLVGGCVALLIPKFYEATATVFPVTAGQGSGLVSQYGALASLVGVQIPMADTGSGLGDPTQVVSALLASRILMEAVARDLDLAGRAEDLGLQFSTALTQERRFNAVVSYLEKQVRSKQDKDTGVISVIVDLPSPELAQRVANRTVGLLDELLAAKSLTINQKKLDLLNKQIPEQKAKLDQYQQEMAQFQRRTQLIDPKTQSGQIFDAFSSLVQQRMALALQLATAEATYSTDNSKLGVLRNQLKNLDDQIAQVKTQTGGGDLPSLKNAPEDLIKYQNLASNLAIATSIYTGLLASQEQAKLQAGQDQVFVEVLDTALLPSEGKPNSLLIVLVSLFLGLCVGVFYAYVAVEGRAGKLGKS